jgi:hypothetical protein
MFVLLVFLPVGDLVSETNNHFHVKKKKKMLYLMFLTGVKDTLTELSVSAVSVFGIQ